MKFAEFIMKSYNEALEMASRQKERYDEVELVDDVRDGEPVTVVLCASR